jgi:DNA-binding response OmpR family regulator
MNVPETETRRVLIVEDENAAREASKQYLQRQGYAVSVAADAAGAMRQVEAHPPNIVVCDWNLGEGPSGTDFARRLQTRFSVPVIFITARPIDKLRREARDIDVVRFFRKPFRLAALARAIDAAARNA